MKPLAWWNIQGPPLLNAQPRAVSEICPHRPRWSWNSESTPSCPKLTSHHGPKIKVFQAKWSSELSWELTKKSEHHPVVLGLSVPGPHWTKQRYQRRCHKKVSSDTCRVHPLGDPPLHNFLGVSKMPSFTAKTGCVRCVWKCGIHKKSANTWILNRENMHIYIYCI